MNENIKEIIKAGSYAPSGENAQPWKFVVKDNVISVYNLPHRDQSLYSWGQRASYIAHGAAIENIEIAAKEFGYESNIILFPNKNEIDLVATIELIKRDISKDSLYEFIFERCTNRKPYDTKSISDQEESELKESVKKENLKLYFTQDENHKLPLGKAGSANEVVMLSNQHLHNFFFTHINWSKKEDDEKKIGFFIDSLELPPPAKVGFKIFKHWHFAKPLHKIGLHKMVGKQNAQINAAAAGFGAITVSENTPENFVHAGRAIQRMWLTATKLDLSIQPLTGILFFMYKILANEKEKFSHKHVKIIESAYKDIQNIFNIDNKETIAFMFRIGYGGKPTARSSRFSIDEVMEIK